MGKDDKQDEKIEALRCPFRMLAQARLFIIRRNSSPSSAGLVLQRKPMGDLVADPSPVQAQFVHWHSFEITAL